MHADTSKGIRRMGKAEISGIWSLCRDGWASQRWHRLQYQGRSRICLRGEERGHAGRESGPSYHHYHCWVCLSFLGCKAQCLNQPIFITANQITGQVRDPVILGPRFHPGQLSRELKAVRDIWDKPQGFLVLQWPVLNLLGYSPEIKNVYQGDPDSA